MELSCEHGADLMLNKEARKWSAKVIRDMRTIRSTTKQINSLMDQIKAAKVLLYSMFVTFLYAASEVCIELQYCCKSFIITGQRFTFKHVCYNMLSGALPLVSLLNTVFLRLCLNVHVFPIIMSPSISGCLQLLEISWNLKTLLEILEISWNLNGPPGNFCVMIEN